MSDPFISIHLDHKTFPSAAGPVRALSKIDLDVEEGGFVVLIGPSGCGKSTLLRIIAGLDLDYAGAVSVGGKRIDGPSPERGFVFQEPRLFPWLTVERNISAGFSPAQPDVRRKIDDLIRLVRLEGFEKSYPKQLSGGMAQRTAIARALYRDPTTLLLDEPFSALDAFTRAHLQNALLEAWLKHGTTTVLVTHDIDEAVTLARRIVVMDARPGSIRAVIPVDLEYPRRRVSPEFEATRYSVLRELETAYGAKEEVRHVA
ncbi:ABC transporter ATP-binding protein [Mesorhizobium sp. CAU 1732]|uniref:ABC transporter ATP-binding protein n=1 Tax=Mesorhizobium sp. CAU 1732 TaxID=3140358 RepID=UPI0032605437